MGKFEFDSGPDRMTAELRHYGKPDENGRSSYISFHGTGPRGGWVGGPVINERYMDALSDMIAEAKGWPHLCKGCGRAEDDCSAEPCAEVIADREDSWTDEPVGPAPILPPADIDRCGACGRPTDQHNVGEYDDECTLPPFTDEEKADMKHNAQMLDGCETEDELNAELRAQTQGN